MLGQPWKFLPLSAFVLLTALPGQDLDTFTFHAERRPFTILDRIEDAEEKEAFRRLLEITEPGEKKRLAEVFLARYPSSWMLSQAYEIAAKASIDTGDYPRALLYGEESLRLLPENPLLLVPLADLQAQQGRLDDAERNARRAIEILGSFERPLRYSEKQWDRLDPELRASAHFALGRAAATRAAKGDAEGAGYWREARESLIRSRRLNPEDRLAAYLLGFVEQGLGELERAAREYADAARSPSPVRTRALDALGKIHKAGGSKEPFERYVAELRSRRPSYRTSKQKPPKASARLEYAGSASCESCHAAEHQAWRQTGMARMFAPYKKENILGDFAKANEFLDDDDVSLVKMFESDGRHYFSFLTPGGDWKRYPVDYTIGSKWQQAYATELPDGEIHVFPIQYTKLESRWLNFWKIIDDPGSARTVVGDFPQHTNATSYQLNCAPCHTSQLRTVSGEIESADMRFREPGINCEMCHGPSQSHVEAMAAGKVYDKPAHLPPIEFGKIDHRLHVTICGQCHMQSGVAKLGRAGAVNYSGEDDFVKRYTHRPYMEFSAKAFYKDGRFRETTFIVESFLRTACYERGKSQCGNCHDPHPADVATNPRSLKFLDNPDHMCTQCHESYVATPEAHTRHAVDSEAGRCTSCHMPRIMNSLLFKAGTHRIDSIPDAEAAARFGPEESPNACLHCHTDQDAAWLKRQLAGWKKPAGRPRGTAGTGPGDRLGLAKFRQEIP